MTDNRIIEGEPNFRFLYDSCLVIKEELKKKEDTEEQPK